MQADLAMVRLTDVRRVEHVDLGAVDVGCALRREQRYEELDEPAVLRRVDQEEEVQRGLPNLLRSRVRLE